MVHLSSHGEFKDSGSMTKLAVAIHPFDAELVKTRKGFGENCEATKWEKIASQFLPLELGDLVVVCGKLTPDGAWLQGYVRSRKETKGIFPATYVRDRRTDKDRDMDPLQQELVLVCREWGEIWKKLYENLVDCTYRFEVIGKAIKELMEGRTHLVTGTLTQDQLRDVKTRLTTKIDWGNRKLGLDLVPRIGCDKVQTKILGAVRLYKVHVKSVEEADAARTTIRNKKKSVNRTVLSASSISSQSNQKLMGHHLYLNVRDFGYNFSDECEVYFSLYDADGERFITERFLVKMAKEGMSSFLDKLPTQGLTIFEDLRFTDLSKHLYLVCQVVRVGKMFYSESSSRKSVVGGNQGGHMYKRPLACGVMSLGDKICTSSKNLSVLSDFDNTSTIGSEYGGFTGDSGNSDPLDDDDKEYDFKLYTSDEKEFHQLHEIIIKTNKASLVSGHGVIVSVKLLTGNLTQIRAENPLLLMKSVSIVGTRRMGFPDVIMPGVVRNDLFITLRSGEFEKGGKATGKNIEVTVSVFDSKGHMLEDVVFGSVKNGNDKNGASNSYCSTVLYHHNSPRWNEVIRLGVPLELFTDAHVRFEYRHCSTKEKNDKRLFGFSFIKLMSLEGTTALDGQHDLYIHKCDDLNRLKNPNTYLKLPYCAGSSNCCPKAESSSQAPKGPKEYLTINTLLVSTKLTQTMDLVKLLRWKSNPDDVKETLENFAKVSGEEVVKFLQDVLDVLFSMFAAEDGNPNEFSDDVFNVLINIFSLLKDGKYEHFKPVIDAYILEHFAATLVYKGLICCVKHYADALPKYKDDHDTIKRIERCFRSLEYIFKFVVQSRVLFLKASQGLLEDSFEKDITILCSSFTAMLANGSSEELIHTQAYLLLNLHKMYLELLRVFSKQSIARLVTKIFASIPLKDSAHRLSPSKLKALNELVNSPMFTDTESRCIILPEICRHVRHHLAHREELKLCTDILGDILIFLYTHFETDTRVHADIEVVATTTIEMLVQSVLVLERTSSIVGNLVACLVGLLQLMDEFHYNRLWDEFEESKPLRDLLLRVFLVFRDLIKYDVFPSDWAAMKLLTNAVMLQALQEFSQALITFFLNKTFDAQLWSQYFNLGVIFLTQESLQLEEFRDYKRDKITGEYGDMRIKMTQQIRKMWANLGPQKIHFIPSMIGPFLEMTLVPQSQLRKSIIPIFYDMMEAEYKVHGNFKQVEGEFVDKLDNLMSQDKGDDEYRCLFHSILTEKINISNPTWKEQGLAFIDSVASLLDILLDYRVVIKGDENRDKRMACTVKLLNFYKSDSNRREMYLRYIYKLHDLNLSAENFGEAGFNLLLHAEMLAWGDDNLPAVEYGATGGNPTIFSSYPVQTETQRKEMIYLRVLKYFDMGKVWEKGIPLCKELAHLYESQLFDYAKLSHILNTQATFYENILTQLRPEPEYFRVGFFGKGFPLFVRNKEFIYRGNEYERLGNFMQRILIEWPSAQVLNNAPPDDSIIESTGKYIQICSVKPIPNYLNSIFRYPHVPEKVRSFYAVNEVKKFVFDRRLPRMAQEDEDNEFKTMWIERCTMGTSSMLPGILRWFEVVRKNIEVLTPIRFACEKMEEVNKQLNTLIGQYLNDQTKNVNPMSMRLQGVIDANVMGGLPKYKEAFFTENFLEENPDSVVYIMKLRNLILEQVTILEKGLEVHGRLVPPGVQPLHQRLMECFDAMKTTVHSPDFCPLSLSPKAHRIPMSRSSSVNKLGDSIRHNVGSIVNSPLPPVPCIQQKISKPAISESNRSSVSNCSSNYGQIVQPQEESDDENVYSKPIEYSAPMTKFTREAQDKEAVTTKDVGKPAAAAPPKDPCPTPPPIPYRGGKRGSNSSKANSFNSSNADSGRSSLSQSEYIIMPPSRLRELNDQNSTNNVTVIPPIPPKPNPSMPTPTPSSKQHIVAAAVNSIVQKSTALIQLTNAPPLPKKKPPLPPPKQDLDNGLEAPPPIPPKPKSSPTMTVGNGLSNPDDVYMNKNELLWSSFSPNDLSKHEFKIMNEEKGEEQVEIVKIINRPKTPTSPAALKQEGTSPRKSHKEFYCLPINTAKQPLAASTSNDSFPSAKSNNAEESVAHQQIILERPKSSSN